MEVSKLISNENSVFFIAGVYGVGKSSLCESLSVTLNIQCYSASDLISARSGEFYGTNKVVRNAEFNQNILLDSVANIMLVHKSILLTGHFCIFNKLMEVELLPEFVFETLPLRKIVLLEADDSIVLTHLKNRDNKQYLLEQISHLRESEKEQALKVANKFSVPLLVHKMVYSNDDMESVKDFISGNGGKIK